MSLFVIIFYQLLARPVFVQIKKSVIGNCELRDSRLWPIVGKIGVKYDKTLPHVDIAVSIAIYIFTALIYYQLLMVGFDIFNLLH